MSASRVILTPEHVEIRLVPAGLGRRFLALIVDGGSALAVAGMLTLVLRIVLPQALLAAAFTTTSFVVGWAWHVAFEAYGQGRTPGKRLLGLRVVDGRGLPVTLEQAFVRNVIRALDFAPVFYGLGGLVCELDPLHRRLGDLAADTLVVREGRALDLPRDTRRSAEWNSLRSPRVLRRVRRRIGLDEAEFLLALTLRAPELADRARYELMEEVGRHYREVLELGDLPLSGQALVRGLASIVFWERRPPSRRGAAPPSL